MSRETTPANVVLDDMHTLMQKNVSIRCDSTYYQIRRSLVAWIADVCKNLGLEPRTVHCATIYMDRYMHQSNLDLHYKLIKYHCFAAASILIAAKQEEHSECVPLISEIINADQCTKIQAKNVSEAELQILVCLGWRTLACTYIHFLDIHIDQGICCPSDMVRDQALTAKDKKNVVKYMYFYADVCLLEAEFSCFSTALTSAAIIAAARQTVRIDPVWNRTLQESTGFTVEKIRRCVELIRTVFCRHWPGSVPNHLLKARTISFHNDSTRSSIDSSNEGLSTDSESMVICTDSIDTVDLKSFGSTSNFQGKRLVAGFDRVEQLNGWNKAVLHLDTCGPEDRMLDQTDDGGAQLLNSGTDFNRPTVGHLLLL